MNGYMLDCDDGKIMIESNSRVFFVSIIVSAVCHLLFFISVIYFLKAKTDTKPFPRNSVIDISMVALPDKVKIDDVPTKKIKQKKNISSEAVSVAEKKSLKKKTYKKKKIKTVKIKTSL